MGKEEEIKQINPELEKKKKEITDKDSKIGSQTSKITEQTSKITELEQKLAELQKKQNEDPGPTDETIIIDEQGSQSLSEKSSTNIIEETTIIDNPEEGKPKEVCKMGYFGKDQFRKCMFTSNGCKHCGTCRWQSEGCEKVSKKYKVEIRRVLTDEGMEGKVADAMLAHHQKLTTRNDNSFEFCCMEDPKATKDKFSKIQSTINTRTSTPRQTPKDVPPPTEPKK